MGKLIEQAGRPAPGVRRLERPEDPPRRRGGAPGRPALVARPDELRTGGRRARRVARQGRSCRDGRRTRRTPAATSRRSRRWTPPTADAASLPVAERKLVTNHDAFGYFAAHYDITVLGSVLDSLSTSAQPSARTLARLVEKIRATHVRAIFTESSVNPKLEQQIAREAGVKVYANLYGDTLGPAGSKGATYVQMERWNVTAIVARAARTAGPPERAAPALGLRASAVRFGRRRRSGRSFDVPPG